MRLSPTDAPSVVASWPCCPRRHQVLWEAYPPDDECNPDVAFDDALDPRSVMAFEVERGTHRGQLSHGAEKLFRVYLHDSTIPKWLMEARAVADAKAGGNG